jgi:hypothetical protein
MFSGDCTIKNGLYQIVLSENTITVYYWNGSSYTKIDDFTAGTFDTITILKMNGDVCTVKTDNFVEIIVERGRVPHIVSPVELECTSLSPDDQSTSSDNYLELGTDLYVCSNRAFSITDGVIGSGDLWVFYAASGVEDVAHDCLVKSNLKRTVVLR